MKVQQMQGNHGPVKNQFVLTDDKGRYFQSYDSVIAFIPKGYPNGNLNHPVGMGDNSIILDSKYWNYSSTTSKYRNLFLGETTKETGRKIKSGEYILANLN